MQTQCLLEAEQNPRLEVQVRFLQFVEQPGASGQEAVERKIEFGPIEIEELQQPRRIDFTFSKNDASEPAGGAAGQGLPVPAYAALQGVLTCSAVALADRLFSVTVAIENHSDCDQLPLQSKTAQWLAFVSTHTILQTTGGQFVSAIDPSERWREFAAQQQNRGTWPVLVGHEPHRDTVLCSPIILYDYPQVAAESPGDLFDATEIDEILSLRVMTLSDEEKQQIRNSDRRAEAILERTENLPDDQFRKLHGAIRGLSRLQTNTKP